MGRVIKPRYRKKSSPKKNATLTEQARKRVVNALGYDPFGKSPKNFFGNS